MNKKIQPKMEATKMCAMNEAELLKVAGGTVDDSNIQQMIIYKCHGCNTTFATPEGYGPGNCPGCGGNNNDTPGLITML